jgi:inosose dehydratase
MIRSWASGAWENVMPKSMEIKIATAPVSWGVVMKDTPNVPPYSQVLDEMREAGYTGTELGPYGYLPQDKNQLHDELDSRGLHLLSAYVQVNFIDPHTQFEVYKEALTTVRLLSEMDCKLVTLSDSLFASNLRAERAGKVRPEDGLDGAGWSSFVKNVNEFAKMCDQDLGLKSAFHPHVGGWIETAEEVDRLMSETDATYVGMCPDTAHTVYGGHDPVKLISRWPDRIRQLHIKECDKAVLAEVLARDGDYFDGVTSNVFPELGKGSVDFQAFHKTLTEIDFSGWAVIEQDILPDSGINALESARYNLEFLKNAGW